MSTRTSLTVSQTPSPCFQHRNTASVRANTTQCGCHMPTVRGSTSMTVKRREKEVTTIGAWQLAHDFTRCDETSKTFLVCKGIARSYWASGSPCWWCAQDILRLPRPTKHKGRYKLLKQWTCLLAGVKFQRKIILLKLKKSFYMTYLIWSGT